MNKTIIPSILLAIMLVSVTAQPNEKVYVVHAKHAAAAQYLKNNYGVRHEFDDKFTTTIPESRIKELTNLADFEEVPIYYIAEKPSAIVSRTCTPSTQKPWGITRVNGGIGGTGINVAVLDTGAKTNHLDLSRRVADCKDFTKGLLIRKGCADANGHGTHVAGTILADKGIDGKGILGVAPQAKLLAYKVCGNDGSCWSDNIAAAIRYAADHSAHIISMSLGGSTPVSIMQDAINYAESKNVLIVAAAGNSGPADNTINYPGAYANAVGVAASDINDNIASFSSRGNNYATTPYLVEERDVEFTAPGVNIESTWNDGCYRTISGTSMATPHISGLAAALWQGTARNTRTFLQGRALIGPDLGRTGDDPDAGFGMPTQ